MTVTEQNGVLEIIVLNNGKKRMESIRGFCLRQVIVI